MKFISIMTDAERASEYKRLTGKDFPPDRVRLRIGRTMAEMYGMNIKHVCGQCRYMGDFKCALWLTAKNRTAVVRAGQAACMKFERKEE